MADPDVGASLVFSEAQRSLTQQDTALESLRSRTVAILTVAAFVAALFLDGVTDHGSVDRTLNSVALLIVVASTLIAVWFILRPKLWIWRGDISPHLQNVRVSNPTTAQDLAYNVGRDMQQWCRANNENLERMNRAYAWLCILLSIEVVLLGVAAL